MKRSAILTKQGGEKRINYGGRSCWLRIEKDIEVGMGMVKIIKISTCEVASILVRFKGVEGPKI